MKYLTYKEKVSVTNHRLLVTHESQKKLKRNYAYWHVSVGEDMVLLIEYKSGTNGFLYIIR